MAVRGLGHVLQEFGRRHSAFEHSAPCVFPKQPPDSLRLEDNVPYERRVTLERLEQICNFVVIVVHGLVPFFWFARTGTAALSV